MKLLAVLFPIAVIALGAWITYGSAKEGSADVSGPGEAFGELLMVSGAVIAVAEILLVLIYKFLTE